MAESLKFFKIDETSVYCDGYTYSFYRALVPTKTSADSPQWFSFQCSLKNQKNCRVQVNTTANWEFDKRGRKFYREIIKIGKHNHEPEHRDTTRRLKFYKNDEWSVIRNGYTYVFHRELDPSKLSGDFEWRMSYHCPVSANNQERCRARIHTTGEWIVDERRKEYQWGTFKNCEHIHEECHFKETIISKTSAHDNRKENHCESSKNGVQGNFRANACEDGQLIKMGQLNLSRKRDVEGEKRYKCNVCHYATSDNYDLTKHLRTHTGERPYKCDNCNYSAAEYYTLVRHERTHSGERPYKCRLCQFASGRSYSLKEHMRTHRKNALKFHAANSKKNTAHKMLKKSSKNY